MVRSGAGGLSQLICDQLSPGTSTLMSSGRLHVGIARRAIAEHLDQDPEVGVVGTPVPVERDVSRLRSSGRRELLNQGGKVVGVLGPHRLLHNDDNHPILLVSEHDASEPGRHSSRKSG
jgi:hypothetical protein